MCGGHSDLVNDRQIRLAKRLADSHHADFEVMPDLQARVGAALGSEVDGFNLGDITGLGIPSCGGPLCTEADHHPVCHRTP